MRHDLARLKDLNARLKPDASSLVVPIIPTISMMEAAADATGVFAPGDRLGEWLLPPTDVSEDGELCDPALAARFGSRRAYELQVMAEIWAGCISGLNEWSRKRGLEGCNAMVDSWFRPQLADCPPCGWPSSRTEVTEEHRSYLSLRANELPFKHCDLWMPHSDLSVVTPAPFRCASIMAMRAGQREFLMEYYLLGLDDVIDMEKLPFIPGHSVEHRFDDEERHRILAAAAWRAAAAAVPGLSEIDEQMPLPPKAAAVYLSRLGGSVSRLTSQIPHYFRDAPYRGLVFSGGSSRLEVRAVGAALTAGFDDGQGGGFTLTGPDFRLPNVQALLLDAVRSMSSAEGGLSLTLSA